MGESESKMISGAETPRRSMEDHEKIVTLEKRLDDIYKEMGKINVFSAFLKKKRFEEMKETKETIERDLKVLREKRQRRLILEENSAGRIDEAGSETAVSSEKDEAWMRNIQPK